MKLSPEEIARVMLEPANQTDVARYIQVFADYCG